LSTEWSHTEAANLLDILDNWLDQVPAHPNSAPSTGGKPRVRGAVSTKHVTMLYHVEPAQQQITILSFFDTRQQPETRTFKYQVIDIDTRAPNRTAMEGEIISKGTLPPDVTAV